MKTGKNNPELRMFLRSLKCPKGTNSLIVCGMTETSFVNTDIDPTEVGPTGRSTTLF